MPTTWSNRKDPALPDRLVPYTHHLFCICTNPSQVTTRQRFVLQSADSGYHAFSVESRVPESPLRIASLLASATEILYALGLGDNVVAISHECDFPASCTTKPRVTRARINALASSGAIDAEVRTFMASGEPLYAIDADLLSALHLDLIVTQTHCEVCAVSDRDVRAILRDHSELRGAKVVSLNPTTLDAVFHDILTIGAATDHAAAAKAYLAKLHNRINAIAARLTAIPSRSRPTVACIEWIDPLMVAANWMPDLIARAGGQPVLTSSGARSTETPVEALRAANPDVIIVSPCGFDLSRTLAETPALLRQPAWQELSAVRARRVFAVDGNAYFNRSGPRLVDTIEILAELIHPTIFPRQLATPAVAAPCPLSP